MIIIKPAAKDLTSSQLKDADRKALTKGSGHFSENNQTIGTHKLTILTVR